MDSHERKIKELTIAMEALSRIGAQYWVDDVMNRIRKLIEERSAILEGKTTATPKPTNLDDEIPF